MKTGPFRAIFPLILGLGLTLLSGTIIHGAQPNETFFSVTALDITPTLPVNPLRPQDRLLARKQTILLWPKDTTSFIQEYSSWDSWVGSGSSSPYALRDELLVFVRAIATKLPGLEITTDEPQSNLILVSGNPVALNVLLERLRAHPLLARFTEDSPAQHEEARSAWAKSDFENKPIVPQQLPRTGINIRTSRAANVVWGYSTPGAMIQVKLMRSGSQPLIATTTANAEGLYHTFLIWDIRADDVVEVTAGGETRKVIVPPIVVLGEATTGLVTGVVSPSSETVDQEQVTSLKVIVGRARRRVVTDSEGKFAADFGAEEFRPGTPGLLSYTDRDGNQLYTPFSVSVVNVRRDTSYGLPWDSVHMMGVSSIVWGSAAPNASLVVTLTRSGSAVVTRTTTADQIGDFSVSADRLIADGDVIQVSDGSSLRAVQVPTMTYTANPATKIITGTAPANIVTTVLDAPHSLEIAFSDNRHQVTTSAQGNFSANFTASPFLAGLVGTMRYTTPSGDRVYKSLFVADSLARGKIGDWRADVILGQPDFSQITFDEVVSNKLFNPGGVYVDRSVQPNRVYVYDAGNSRILGLSHLGYVQSGPYAGQPCTSNSDYPGSICQIQEDRAADIVIGQPSFNSSVCNGDSGYQIYPDVSLSRSEKVL